MGREARAFRVRAQGAGVLPKDPAGRTGLGAYACTQGWACVVEIEPMGSLFGLAGAFGGDVFRPTKTKRPDRYARFAPCAGLAGFEPWHSDRVGGGGRFWRRQDLDR